MASRWALVFLLSSLPWAGCGGRVDHTTPGEPSYGTASADGGATESPWPKSPLGPCVLGHPYGEGGGCTYLVDGRCYETVQAACNCACPKSHDSVCASDFPDPNGAPAVVVCG